IVDVAYERDAVDHDALRAAAHLDAAEHERAGVARPLGLIAHLEAVHAHRMLRRVQVLARRAVDRLVARIAGDDEPRIAPREWLERREDDEVVLDDLATGPGRVARREP